jgi:hypothetical protein
MINNIKKYYSIFFLLVFFTFFATQGFSLSSFDLTLENENSVSVENKKEIKSIVQENNTKDEINTSVSLAKLLTEIRYFDNKNNPAEIENKVVSYFKNLDLIKNNEIDTDKLKSYLSKLNSSDQNILKSILFRYSIAVGNLKKVDNSTLKDYLLLSTNDSFTMFPEVAVILGNITKENNYYEKYLDVIRTYYKTPNLRQTNSFKNHVNILLYIYKVLQENYNYKLSQLDTEILQDCLALKNINNFRITTLHYFFPLDDVYAFYNKSLQEKEVQKKEVKVDTKPIEGKEIEETKETKMQKQEHITPVKKEENTEEYTNNTKTNQPMDKKTSLALTSNIFNTKESTSPDFKNALSALHSEDYLKSFALFENIYKKTNDSKAKYYMCVIYYKTQKYNEAITCFNSLDPKKHPLALWNLAAIYNKGLGVEKNIAKAYEYYNQYLNIKKEISKNLQIPLTNSISLQLDSYLSEITSLLYLIDPNRKIDTFKTKLNNIIDTDIKIETIYNNDYLKPTKLVLGFDSFERLSYMSILFDTDSIHTLTALKSISEILNKYLGTPDKSYFQYVGYTSDNIYYEIIPAVVWDLEDVLVTLQVEDISGRISLKVKNKKTYADTLEILQLKQM